jgi:hypothetical protein
MAYVSITKKIIIIIRKYNKSQIDADLFCFVFFFFAEHFFFFFFFFFFLQKIFESADALRQQRRRVLSATHLFDALLEVTDAGAATDAVRAARDRFATSRDALQTACAPLLKVLDNATLTAQLKRDKVRKFILIFFVSFFAPCLHPLLRRTFIWLIWHRISVFPNRTWVHCIVLPMQNSLAVTMRAPAR